MSINRKSKSGDWRCKCQVLNFSYRDKCFSCNRHKHEIDGPNHCEGKWLCICKTLNQCGEVFCINCARRQPSMHKISKGDWVCICETFNFSFRDKCLNCDLKNPSSGKSEEMVCPKCMKDLINECYCASISKMQSSYYFKERMMFSIKRIEDGEDGKGKFEYSIPKTNIGTVFVVKDDIITEIFFQGKMYKMWDEFYIHGLETMKYYTLRGHNRMISMFDHILVNMTMKGWVMRNFSEDGHFLKYEKTINSMLEFLVLLHDDMACGQLCFTLDPDLRQIDFYRSVKL